MNNALFIHVEDKDYVEPESVLTVASTNDQEIPWELREDPDEDRDVLLLPALLQLPHGIARPRQRGKGSGRGPRMGVVSGRCDAEVAFRRLRSRRNGNHRQG